MHALSHSVVYKMFLYQHLFLFLVISVIDSRPILNSKIINSSASASTGILPASDFRTVSHVLTTCGENEVLDTLGNCAQVITVTNEVELDLFELFGLYPEPSTEQENTTYTKLQDYKDERVEFTTEFDTTTEPFDFTTDFHVDNTEAPMDSME